MRRSDAILQLGLALGCSVSAFARAVPGEAIRVAWRAARAARLQGRRYLTWAIIPS